VHGLNVNFNNTSINSSGLNNVRFYWDFGDSTGSYNKYPIKTFATGGPKIVTLHLYDSATTCSSFYIDTIWLASAGNNCAASFTHIVNPPFSVSLLSTSTNTNGSAQGLNYLWQFSDSSIANGLSLTKTFTTPGYKWVKLSISDSASGCFAHVVDTFFIPGANSQCASNFTATTNGLTATFNNQSLNTNGTVVGLSYLWSFGDGTNSSLKNPIKTYGSGGPKIVQLSIFDSTQNCFSSKYDSLFLVIPIPVCRASFSMVKDTITPFNFYILNTSLVRSSSTYFWTFGDGSSSTSITPSHSYANFGIYLICLTVSDSICTSTFCDSVGMDSTGILLKGAAFGFKTLDFTTLSGANSLAQIIGSGQTNIYPNPSSGTFNVEVNVNSAAPITFEISDLSGKILLTKTVQAASGKLLEEFDLSNYIPSMYFLSVSSNERIATYKIIKN
jgi:PKD repeat protein